MYRALWLGAGLLVVLVLAMITGFQPLYWLLYAVGIGGILAYLWAWVQSRGLDTDIQELSPHPHAGESVDIRVTVSEKVGLPRMGLRARLVGDFVTTDEEDFSLSPHGTANWTVSGLCQRRGLNNIGSLAMVSGDPTGLSRLEARVGEPQSILVYPATVELSRAVAEGQSAAGEIGEAGQMVGHSPAASMVRQYAPGDSLTHIHWPTTARLDHLMTKEFEGAGTNEIRLFLDMQEAAQAGIGDDGTEEYGITVAASLTKRLIGDGHSVGLVTQGDQLYRFAPRKDTNHMWAMLRALALVRATGKTAITTLISQESGNLGAGTVAMVIAPWPGQSLARVFQFLTRRGILPIPIYLDAASFGRPPEPRWTSDRRSETQGWTTIVKRGDDLSTTLGGLLDRLASY